MLHMTLTMCLKFDLKNLNWRVGALGISVDSAKQHTIDAATHLSAGRNKYPHSLTFVCQVDFM